MSFTNVYYKRTAGTAKSCYVCYRPTTTVLATINTVDFIYACPGHLSDANFATRIADAETSSAAKSSVSPEEIAKIKQEWEEKQKKKQEKEKGKEDGKEKENGKDKKSDAESSKEASKSPTPAPAPTTPAAPTHERYSLHRDFYAS
ncbi:hypothetical protein EST38_g46 [Candolleomyces aberdarensis]|uniref:DUF1742-domain-containing protein n=1 Tax=Candolleomyces aberdarensis TaxID=2316362 RepID=A0A4Q2DYL1_9AGAR|nr:hypothetical protein EST38_g46 [Candolleomyces aberdarensis]